MSAKLFIVMLRRPRKDDPRTDPFWEFGSFGCTGCHGKNLLHPKNCRIADGDRLAFVQGGHQGSRLLLVTPTITRVDHVGGGPKGRVELRWDSRLKPFRYDCAPSLFESPGSVSPGMFARLAEKVSHTNRSTVDAKFSSRFRARSSPLDPEIAEELEAGFNAAVKAAKPSDFITKYEDALPWCDCPTPSSERREDYRTLLKDLKRAAGVSQQRSRCCK